MTAGRATQGTVELGPEDVLGTVLCVDDDPAILDAVSDFLREEGFRVLVASNGIDALRQLRTAARPDVILLDVMMPLMDGWDFRAAQLDDPALRDIPVVVVSAAGFSSETIRHQLKAREVLRKPLELREFLSTVQGLCGRDDSRPPSWHSRS